MKRLFMAVVMSLIALASSCPDASAIAPCFCTSLNDVLVLDCSLVQEETEFDTVFMADFPEKLFSEFRIIAPSPLQVLNFSTNGVSFEKFILTGTPSDALAITTISEQVFQDSASVVTTIEVTRSQLTAAGFPFDSISSYPNLFVLSFYGGVFAEMPAIVSDSVAVISMGENDITALEPGVLSGLPNLTSIILEYNQLTELVSGTFSYGETPLEIDLLGNQIQSVEAGAFSDGTGSGSGQLATLIMNENSLTSLPANSIPITSSTSHIYMNTNLLSSIEPGAFYIASEPSLDSIDVHFSFNDLAEVDEGVFGPIMPYVSVLHLEGNPLGCFCDVAWIVLNEEYLAKVSTYTVCQDGTPINELDPSVYEVCT